MTIEGGHIPVLLNEVLEILGPLSGETAIDLTLGLGGHAAELARRIGPGGTLIGFDLDESNLERARQVLDSLGERRPRIDLHHASYAEAESRMRETELRADVVLADLGFASTQVDDSSRGFGFGAEGPLDMRFDRAASVSAATLVNECSAEELARIITAYGEDPYARRIAAQITEKRQSQPIETTTELAKIVVEAYGSRARQSRMHPATRTFQALRIAVNSEIENLGALADSIRRCVVNRDGARNAGWLCPGARVGIIAFHSLEDRLVKRLIGELNDLDLIERLTRKPIRASEREVEENPRSRSAKFRAFRVK